MRRFLVAWLACIALMLPAQEALAHATLLETTPADGALLDRAPAEIVLRFNEPVALVRLDIIDAAGTRIAPDGTAKAEGETIRLALPQAALRGSYIVSYRVISADSHPIGGSFIFSVGNTSATARAERTANTALIPYTIVRAIFLFAALLAGGYAIASRRLPGNTDRKGAAAAFIALLAGALSLGLKGAQLLDAPLDALVTRAPWETAAQSSLGLSLLVGGIGLWAIIVAAMLRPSAGRGALELAGGALAVGSFILTGHAATAEPLMRGIHAVHVLTAAYWLGALPILRAALSGDVANAAAALKRFSSDAMIAVALLAAAGVVLAVTQIDAWSGLATTYGALLVTKLMVVLVLLVLAAINRFMLTPQIIAAPANALRKFKASIAAEYVLFALILALTAALTQQPPPRLENLTVAAVAQTVTVAQHRISLDVSPARAGENTMTVDVVNAAGTHVTPKEIWLELSRPGIEPIRRQAVRNALGHFVHRGGEMITPGRWQVVVRVLIDDFTEVPADFDVTIN